MGRLRPDPMLYFPAPPANDGSGRPVRHVPELGLADPATWPGLRITTSTVTTRYGMATACAWDLLHPGLTHRAARLGHDGERCSALRCRLLGHLHLEKLVHGFCPLCRPPVSHI
jgi:hypothetical protein